MPEFEIAGSPEPAIALDIIKQFGGEIPFLKALSTAIDFLDRGRCGLSLPWAENLVGDVSTGVVHGGVITSLLDSASGMAVFSVVPRPMQIATLDLRIDYLRPATPHADIKAEADCYRLSKNVAFVRGRAFQDGDREIASSLATFMLDSSSL
ncbi:MAG: PaaI family thioesterase [Alphaproteobacteria bacterium]|nr:PaaI family thioesterase [Alphaproteobacteria bacterium]